MKRALAAIAAIAAIAAAIAVGSVLKAGGGAQQAGQGPPPREMFVTYYGCPNSKRIRKLRLEKKAFRRLGG